MVLQLTVFWYIGAVLGHVCLGLGVLALVTMLLSWVFFFPQWGLGVCVVLWSVGCKSIQFLVHSFNTKHRISEVGGPGDKYDAAGCMAPHRGVRPYQLNSTHWRSDRSRWSQRLHAIGLGAHGSPARIRQLAARGSKRFTLPRRYQCLAESHDARRHAADHAAVCAGYATRRASRL